MNATQLSIHDAFLFDLEKRTDERGFLSRWWDQAYFKTLGVEFSPVEGYTCVTLKKGTLRGFHYTTEPETKLTRVIRGSLYEAIVDLRPDSKTYLQSFGITISATDYKLFLTPPGCAHAVLTLVDDTEYMSLYSPAYNPAIERGIRYNDPAISVQWPIEITSVSEKDLSWPNI